MISCNNFELLRRFLAFIFIFSGIFPCAFGLSRSAESPSPAVNAAEEKIATFDENEGAALVSEHSADTSSLLYAEHHQSPVNLPERQKRYVTPHLWIRIIPFALLVMLAFATTPFFGKRRGKTIISVLIFLIITTTAGVANAQKSIPTKDAVVSFLGNASKIYEKDMLLTPDIRKTLKQKLYWEPKESSIKVYYSKTPSGAVEAYAFVLSDTLMQCGGRHKYCIKVSSKGQVEGVKVLELTCYRSFAISNERYLDKFKVMNTTNADKTKVDAITGATISSKLTVMVVRRALALFELLKGSAND
jgi:Na+-translocating ferredoxin:NAD+ oxidoreductase RnfG subunit